jgi:hypothetical protein
MDKNEKKEMFAIMAKHFEEAEYIKSNIDELKKLIGEEVRTEVKKICEERFNDEFIVFHGNDTSNQYSQIWLKFKKHLNANLFFGIESFSHLFKEEMYVGILNNGAKDLSYIFGERSESNWWPYYTLIDDFEGYKINFDESKTLERLYFDKDFKSRFALHLVNELEKFINIYKGSLLKYLDEL